MTTLSTSPALPISGKDTAVTFTLTEPGANFVRIWCTEAPDGSELAGRLKEAAAFRVEVFKGDGNAGAPWRARFDRGGRYVFKAQEYAKGASSYGGGYKGDPAGFATETKASVSEATLTLHIAQRLEFPIGTGADTATLVFYVLDATIQATTVALHGELTPAIVNTSSPRAATAAGATTVDDAIDALVGVTATAALGSVADLVEDLIAKFNAHIASAVFHNAADADNTVRAEFASAPTPANVTNAANELLRRLRQHMQNDSGSGTGSASYHRVMGANVADFVNAPVFQSAGSPAEALAALADVWRAYEAHRISTAVHASADNTNTLAALSKLLDVHRYFAAALASTAPAPEPGQSVGMALLHQWGGKAA